MTCQECEAHIGDLVDGALDAAAADDVRAHLAACAACRALADDLAAVRALARTLEAPPVPPRVWAGIETGLQRQTGRGSLALGWWQLAASAAMILVLVTALSWVGAGLRPLGAPGGAPVATTAAAAVAEPPLQVAAAQYSTAIAGLEEMASAEQGTLDAETAGVLQANLSVIDDAIEESRAALESEPDNTLAQESLFEAMRSKVELLQDMLALVNEMRKGDPEGTARAMSEINQ